MTSKRMQLLLVLIGAGVLFLVYRYRQPRFIAGETAPDFTATLLNNERARLYDLRGKYVLLQFWGSWCGPCRAENPYLVELYKKYMTRGFEIFSIGIEQSPASWQRAIRADGMVWKYHTAEFEDFEGPLAKMYNIHAIPATFLINPQGVIMGVNQSPETVDKMLETGLSGR